VLVDPTGLWRVLKPDARGTLWRWQYELFPAADKVSVNS
jgi:hypothetical protein